MPTGELPKPGRKLHEEGSLCSRGTGLFLRTCRPKRVRRDPGAAKHSPRPSLPSGTYRDDEPVIDGPGRNLPNTSDEV
jgi:hypothetical protein